MASNASDFPSSSADTKITEPDSLKETPISKPLTEMPSDEPLLTSPGSPPEVPEPSSPVRPAEPPAPSLPETLVTGALPQAQQQQMEARAQVRLNFLEALRNMTRSNRLFLLLHLSISFIQIVAGIVILSLYFTRESCDNPLHVYIIGQILRLIVGIPFVFHQYMYPQAVQMQHDNPSRFERMRSVLDLFATLWFVAGNWWLFTASQCEVSARNMYYLSLSYIILGYIVFLFPVVLVLSIILCLPLVLSTISMFRRTTGIDLMENLPAPAVGISRMRRAPEDAIKKIKTTEFNTESTDIASEDANCVICLASYADGDQLKRLPFCKHHFHADCLDEWLRVNKVCPLCVQDIEEAFEKEEKENENTVDGNRRDGQRGRWFSPTRSRNENPA